MMALRAHKAHIFPEACSSKAGGQWDYGFQINGTYKRQATASLRHKTEESQDGNSD
jgi:hypothetical protein